MNLDLLLDHGPRLQYAHGVKLPWNGDFFMGARPMQLLPQLECFIAISYNHNTIVLCKLSSTVVVKTILCLLDHVFKNEVLRTGLSCYGPSSIASPTNTTAITKADFCWH